jgi:glycosyltransferase involved in cell wall biosynthesis
MDSFSPTAGPARMMISVVLPVRNGLPWLEEQLRALADQECPEPWEVIVADNGSRDGSGDVARRWAKDHERFRVVDASALAGAPAARNVGVRAARGDLIAFCDADDVVWAGWLAACAEALRHADIVAGAFDFWSLNGTRKSATAPAAIRQLGFLPAGLGANLAVRRSVFDGVGGFNEDLLLGEDIDLCWRLQLQGFQFAYAPDAVVAKRELTGFGNVFKRSFSYGRSGPALFRRYRSVGARRNLVGAAKSWAWLVISLPLLFERRRRTQWARAAGMRSGRLVGSVTQAVFFP